MSITDEVKKLSEQEFFGCIQCGICTSSCPAFLDFNLRVSPRMINKILVEGDENKVLECELIKYCMSCLRCSVRCPKGIDVSKIIDALRFYVMRKKKSDISKPLIDILSKAPQIAFLESNKLSSRVKELVKVNKIPFNKLQKSDYKWDLETRIVEEIIQYLRT